MWFDIIVLLCATFMKTCSEAWGYNLLEPANGIHVAASMEMKGLVTVVYVCIRSLNPDRVFNPVGYFFMHDLLHFSYKIFSLETNQKMYLLSPSYCSKCVKRKDML